MSSSIKPTVGRVVLVHHPDFPLQPDERFGCRPAIVTQVNLDGTINCNVMRDPSDMCFPTVSAFVGLPIHDPIEGRMGQVRCSKNSVGAWAEWMPYQKGQAQKTEEVEKAATARLDDLGARVHKLERAAVGA